MVTEKDDIQPIKQYENHNGIKVKQKNVCKNSLQNFTVNVKSWKLLWKSSK